jgi:hypothetical protein
MKLNRAWKRKAAATQKCNRAVRRNAERVLRRLEAVSLGALVLVVKP